VEEEISRTLQITRGGAVHIVMKDTNTFCGEPDRVTRWAAMAVRAAEESA
jgi:hypothetical protein